MTLDLLSPPLTSRIERRIEQAAEHLRELHEAGEIDWEDIDQISAYHAAFLD